MVSQFSSSLSLDLLNQIVPFRNYEIFGRCLILHINQPNPDRAEQTLESGRFGLRLLLISSLTQTRYYISAHHGSLICKAVGLVDGCKGV
jgi:hypothetical protein